MLCKPMKGLNRKILARDIGIQNFAVNLIVIIEASINHNVRVFSTFFLFVDCYYFDGMVYQEESGELLACFHRTPQGFNLITEK